MLTAGKSLKSTAFTPPGSRHIIRAIDALAANIGSNKRLVMMTPKSAPVRLLTKAEVLHIAGVSFPTLWSWMRAGKFPRARISAGGGSKSKSVWRSDEVEQWLDRLPVRPLKDDPPPAKSQLNVKA